MHLISEYVLTSQKMYCLETVTEVGQLGEHPPTNPAIGIVGGTWQK